MIASPGAAASPASTDAVHGAHRQRAANPPPSPASRPPYISSPPDRPQRAARQSSGSVPERSYLHGRGIGAASSPMRDQRRSFGPGDQRRPALERARSKRRWQLRQRVVRCGPHLHPIASVLPIPSAIPCPAIVLDRPCLQARTTSTAGILQAAQNATGKARALRSARLRIRCRQHFKASRNRRHPHLTVGGYAPMTSSDSFCSCGRIDHAKPQAG